MSGNKGKPKIHLRSMGFVPACGQPGITVMVDEIKNVTCMKCRTIGRKAARRDRS